MSGAPLSSAQQRQRGTAVPGVIVAADAGSVRAEARMRPALTDKQIAWTKFRVALFQRRGLSEDAAEKLADRLADRWHQGDTRRICLECVHLQRPGTCFIAQQGRLPGELPLTQFNTDPLPRFLREFAPVPTLLQHCFDFKAAKPA